MNIRRVVPNIASAEPDLCREFYAGFLGMRVALDLGWMVTYVSSSNPTAQIPARGTLSQNTNRQPPADTAAAASVAP